MTRTALLRSSQVIVLTLLTGLSQVEAVTIVECIDESGQSSFRDSCPPGSIKKGEKRLRGNVNPPTPVMAEIVEKHPVTLYSIPKCEGCELVRLQLKARGVPFTDKDASTDGAVRKELQELLGVKDGLMNVPVVHIDDTILREYDAAALTAALDKAGYPPEAGSPPNSEATAAGTASTAGAPEGMAAQDAGEAAATAGTAPEPASDTSAAPTAE
jgi:glutaredoxin